ncbi:RNA polymerase sigma factor [Streptomyces sp. TRM49041]|uniref:RNA polymerase sigma factor n=1 Tax=Streptomyces sp. TRM49041 TaxID=2603216 RepID=UPI00165687DB|nr:sigma factor-like helix-turn-helix DNA-binding protein [Streptomyces sp. TRM49041]
MPLTAEESARLGELFEEHGSRLVRYAQRKLMNRGLRAAEAASLSEDIAQEAWVAVARMGAGDVLAPGLSSGEVLPMLYVRVQNRIFKHFERSMSSEQPVDWQDATTCAALCPLMPSGCALAELPQNVARMVAELPDREREALLLSLDGAPGDGIAEHLGCGRTTAWKLIERALLLLQIHHPELSREPVAEEALPGWQREALARVNPAQRAALLRLDDLSRRALLLFLVEGLTRRAVAERLGLKDDSRVGFLLSGCGSPMRRLGADDMEQAA